MSKLTNFKNFFIYYLEQNDFIRKYLFNKTETNLLCEISTHQLFQAFYDNNFRQELTTPNRFTIITAEDRKYLEQVKNDFIKKTMSNYKNTIEDSKLFLQLKKTIEIITELKSALSCLNPLVKYEIHLFGGALRDIVLNKDINDLDVAITMEIKDSANSSKKHFMAFNKIKRFLLKNQMIDQNYTVNCLSPEVKFLLVKAALKNSNFNFEDPAKQNFNFLPKGNYDITTLNDHIGAVIKARAKHSFPVDLVICQKDFDSFLKRNDFSLCKISLPIATPLINFTNFVAGGLQINNFLSQIKFTADFLVAVQQQKNILNTMFLDFENINHSLKNRFKKINAKYPDYPLYISHSEYDNLKPEKEAFVDSCLIETELKLKESSPDNKFKI